LKVQARETENTRLARGIICYKASSNHRQQNACRNGDTKWIIGSPKPRI